MKKMHKLKKFTILALSIIFIIGCSFALTTVAWFTDTKSVQVQLEMGKAVDVVVPSDVLEDVSDVMPGEVLTFKNVVISANDSSLCYLRAKISLQFKDSSDNIISADWLTFDDSTSISGWFYDSTTQWWYYGSAKNLDDLSVVSNSNSAQLKIEDQSVDTTNTHSTMLPLSKAELFINFEAIQTANMQTDTVFTTQSWVS